MAFSGFDRAFFAFLKELKANNRREWFAEHKARYLQVVEAPALAFVAEFAPKLKAISPRFVADPRRVGGSLFRIYRDTRFSPDKSPYKTHVAMRFPHDGKNVERPPSFYLHLAPGDCMGGGGLYHTDPVALRKIRSRIHDAPREWKAVLDAHLDIQGAALSRVPAGFDAQHPFAEDLKRKDHYAIGRFTATQVGAGTFADTYAESCERIVPLVRFLTEALGLRW